MNRSVSVFIALALAACGDNSTPTVTSGGDPAGGDPGACGIDCNRAIPNGTGTCDTTADPPRCVVDTCDPDHVQLDDDVCSPPPDVSCKPCGKDEDCYGGACLTLAGANACVMPCEGSTCADGFECTDQRCQPETGTCSCTDATAGQTRACTVTNAEGTCFGFESCDAAAGWSGCDAATPAAELCDGIDNDCDGQVDEGVTAPTTACEVTNPNGTCTGVWTCDGDGGWACGAATPAAESCDGADNNCDGEVDEPFTDLFDACAAGTGACRRFGFFECTSDGSGTVCNATPGPADTEICDGADNNCDGRVDEDWTDLGDACVVGTGACLAGGVRICDPTNAAGPTVCDATPGPAGTETCNGLDDDCNGTTDDGFVNTQGSGTYDTDTTCGNCYTDCTAIYAKPNAFGRCNATGPTPVCVLQCDPGFFDLNGIPDDGCELWVDPAGIYVSAGDGSNDGACGLGPWGTGSNFPCADIATGLARADALTRTTIYVASGAYLEEVELADGVALLGGYNPVTWGRDVLANQTTIVGNNTTGGHRKAVSAAGVSGRFDGFTVVGENAGPGLNSYAMWVRDCSSNLEITNNTIIAGNGGRGGRGAAPVTVDDSVDGQPGAGCIDTQTPTCAGSAGAGGSGGILACDLVNVSGGNGGSTSCPNGCDAQASGTAGTAGSGPGGTAGSAGNDYQSDAGCGAISTCGNPNTGGNGGDGPDGNAGNAGNGCAAPLGGVTPGGDWIGSGGLSGGDGTHGGGGGGGGAGGGLDNNDGCSYDDLLGGAGGGGGSGGCGGDGGGGGGSGGGAFGIFVSLSAPTADVPTISGNTITRGNGGDGGDGGAGAAGELGGKGGPGGDVSTCPLAFTLGPGGDGGEGGRGGHGGGGGGGCGGASFGIFSYNHEPTAPPAWDTDNTFAGGGAGGAGGAGGVGGVSLANDGTDGATGASGDVNF